VNVDCFRKRKVGSFYKVSPEEYLEKLELKRYANNTVKTYLSFFEVYINYFKEVEIKSLDENYVRRYLKHLINKGKSDSYLNQAINSIKFYYEMVLGMPNRLYSIERPRKKQKHPTVLSKEVIVAMLKTIKNLKHNCVF
jgi:integrase/recombinase XerD